MRFEKSPAETYIEKVFVKELPERLAILEDLRLKEKNGIEVSANEGHLLKFLAQMIGAQKIVEIGTLFGYSTSWFVESLPNDGKVWSFEKEELHYKFATKHLQSHIKSKKLEIIHGEALTELKAIESKGPFDLVFIDANKSGYMNYFNWADQNLKPKGLIIADNTFLLGKVFSDEEPSNHKKAWKIMRELNQTLANHPGYISTLIPTAEGLTIGQKK
jgi:predicted O-methyltransferase YrrM